MSDAKPYTTEDLVNDYYGELDPRIRATVEAHEAACAAAQRMYDHFILYLRDCNAPAEQWAAGSVLLNAALPLELRRVVK